MIIQSIRHSNKKLAVLTSGKKVLEQTVSKTGDLFFQMKAHADDFVMSKASTVKAAYTAMQEHLSETKEEVAINAAMDVAGTGLKEATDHMIRLASVCSIHQDGYKGYKKTYAVAMGK